MRPDLSVKLSAEVFKDYYWLKQELIDFSREHRLPTGGSKRELTQRIIHFLNGGSIDTKTRIVKSQRTLNVPLRLSAIIPQDYKNDERHRTFFKAQIGDHFKFTVPFMQWMKSNSGKTYREAIENCMILTDKSNRGRNSRLPINLNITNTSGIFFCQQRFIPQRRINLLEI